MLRAAGLLKSRSAVFYRQALRSAIPCGRRSAATGPRAAPRRARSVGSGTARRALAGASDAAAMGERLDHAAMMAAARALVPPLTADSHKGKNGKVGVVGGCREYAGAPLFAALSAVRAGADLAHVFCTPGAAPVIKGYSPELIVLPFLPDESAQQGAPAAADAPLAAIRPWLGRLTALVVGPGLGDDPAVAAAAAAVVREARAAGLPLVVDGSGLNLVAQSPELVRGYRRCILTPNLPEFGRLAAGVGLPLPGPIGAGWQAHTRELAAAFGGPVVVSKGPVDVISDGRRVAVVEAEGSLRRAGGQGDVLAGSIAAFACWAFPRHPGSGGGGGDAAAAEEEAAALMAAAYGGCALLRAASLAAFGERGRSMLAGDIIPHLQGAFEELYEGGGSGGGGGARM
ncbi:ATP-dependent (S)-NAD(P)H-hydrate dehydratase [Raphidocelis subcapitata]|uniref:ATP-dependent (S)-NAD(P)H-hydrate dehydratase n=1 Tax=Raphidocelis subcapitata TaxID=307507 RepID=A0A2V0PEN7_9CHLO|nr:ATP-dependent (S)-NAD(P)H-hydrate dehydratase [Raphidocelis subcapitata]|eukprot:GBF96350.1 ATP-dependent (S)-NAD(P)H-hydrate dehydratase [Raphidocelis subcapitata]